MPAIRTFVAVELPDSVRARAAELVDTLRVCGAKVTWVKPENMHLTLKFLGDVPQEEIADVCRAVGQGCAAAGPFEIRCQGTGAFPSASRPRTIWIGVSAGESEMVELHRAVDSSLGKIGLARDRRRYHPHLTIGRVRYAGSAASTLAELIQRHAQFDAGPALINEVRVIASYLDKTGPTYEILSRVPLG